MKMENKNNTLFVGFSSIQDFVQTALGWKNASINLIIACIAGISTFITNYIWDDASAVFFMVFLIAVDFITGVARSIRSKPKSFSSARMPRAFVILVAYCLLLSIGWNAAHFSVLFIFLPGVIWGGLISTLILSILENLILLKIIDKTIFSSVIDKLKSIIKK